MVVVLFLIAEGLEMEREEVGSAMSHWPGLEFRSS